MFLNSKLLKEKKWNKNPGGERGIIKTVCQKFWILIIGGTAGDAYQSVAYLKTTNKYQQFIIDTCAPPNCFLKLYLGWFNLWLMKPW